MFEIIVSVLAVIVLASLSSWICDLETALYYAKRRIADLTDTVNNLTKSNNKSYDDLLKSYNLTKSLTLSMCSINNLLSETSMDVLNRSIDVFLSCRPNDCELETTKNIHTGCSMLMCYRLAMDENYSKEQLIDIFGETIYNLTQPLLFDKSAKTSEQFKQLDKQLLTITVEMSKITKSVATTLFIIDLEKMNESNEYLYDFIQDHEDLVAYSYWCSSYIYYGTNYIYNVSELIDRFVAIMQKITNSNYHPLYDFFTGTRQQHIKKFYKRLAEREKLD